VRDEERRSNNRRRRRRRRRRTTRRKEAALSSLLSARPQPLVPKRNCTPRRILNFRAPTLFPPFPASRRSRSLAVVLVDLDLSLCLSSISISRCGSRRSRSLAVVLVDLDLSLWFLSISISRCASRRSRSLAVVLVSFARLPRSMAAHQQSADTPPPTSGLISADAVEAIRRSARVTHTLAETLEVLNMSLERFDRGARAHARRWLAASPASRRAASLTSCA